MARQGRRTRATMLVLVGLALASSPAQAAPAPACLGQPGAPDAALCPLLGSGVVASCVAYGALVTRDPPLAQAAVEAFILGDDTSDWDAAYRPELRIPLGLDFALRVRGLRAECAAESHLLFAGEHGFRRAWGVAGALQVSLEHGFFGTVFDLRGLRFRAFEESSLENGWSAEGACAMGESWDPFRGALPCPPMGEAPGFGGVRVRVGESWGPMEVPGTGLTALGGAAVHLEFPDATHVYLGYTAVALRPLA